MKKLFLISLMALCTCVMAFAGNRPEPQAFPFNQEGASMKVPPIKRFHHTESISYEVDPSIFVDEQDQVVYLDYGTTHEVYHTIQDAFNHLPINSTPAKVTLGTNIYVTYTSGPCVSLSQYHNVTLDLAGFTLYGTTPIDNASTCVIGNYGTLTIIDGEAGTGKIINEATNLDDWIAAGAKYPRYANNVISNNGTLVINGGFLQNLSRGSASYVFDNYSVATATINGGLIHNHFTDPIRLFCNSTTKDNKLIVNGGIIEGYYPIWIQTGDNFAASKATLIINGGEIESHANAYIKNGEPLKNVDGIFVDAANEKTNSENVTIEISGGVFKTNIDVYSESGAAPKVTITGGTFNGYVDIHNPDNFEVQGGVFDFNNAEGYSDGGIDNYDWNMIKNHVHPAYVLHHVDGKEEADLIYEVVPAESVTINSNSQLKDVETTLGENEELSSTIVSIDGGGTVADPVTVTVTVEKKDTVEVHGINTAKGTEGQLVVKDSAVLVIGNGGLVSENNDLTQVVVEAGGTVMVGTGGINKQGEATPIEIQSDGDKSGVLLIDPNAPDSVAEAIAKVVVYTRAHKDNGIEYWQQLASPVKGNRKNENKIIVKALNDDLVANSAFYTTIFGWDYATDSWVRITTGEGMEDLGDGVYAFHAQWTTTDAVLEPFAAYDLINNSHASHGGVTYEFAGELVGNNDMELNFPENGFCTFGNSYTAPIDLTTLFAKIEQDMNTANIDPCVYMYNSQADRYESVNSLGLWLKELGIMDVAFTQIPPQQAFVMNLLTGSSAQSAVDYATCVWGNPNANKNTPIMAPKRQQAATFSALLNIEVTDGKATDRVVLVEDEKYSDAYDNSADAEKYMNNNFNIYANAERNLAMVASDNIEGTELTFAAGNAVNYTMSFGKTMGEFVLVDRANNNQIAIVEGGIYSFAAQPNSTMEGRFAIVDRANAPTTIENTEVKANVKGIYTIMGQYLGEDFNVLPAGVYVIDGVKIVK